MTSAHGATPTAADRSALETEAVSGQAEQQAAGCLVGLGRDVGVLIDGVHITQQPIERVGGVEGTAAGGGVLVVVLVVIAALAAPSFVRYRLARV